jgi:hypothetical protein
MVTTTEIRAWATRLPEVTEKQHVRLKVPLWQVRGKTFVGMGRDETTAVFCITKEASEHHRADRGLMDSGGGISHQHGSANPGWLAWRLELGHGPGWSSCRLALRPASAVRRRNPAMSSRSSLMPATWTGRSSARRR